MSKGIVLEYYDGLFENKEIDDLEMEINEIGFDFHLYDKSGVVFNSLEDFTNSIILHLSDEVIQAYTLGLFTNASFEALKATISKILDKVQGKKLTKIQGGQVKTEDASFGLKVRINDYNCLDIRLTGEFDDIDKDQVIERAFQIAEKAIEVYPDNIKSDLFAYHDNGEWNVYNVNDEIRKKVYSKNK